MDRGSLSPVFLNPEFVLAPATARPTLILASASPRRRQLLEQIGIVADAVIACDIDETPLKTERPLAHARRLARDKAEAGRRLAADQGLPMNAFILSADTVVGVGTRILPKAEDAATARRCLDLLSGRAHRVYTGVALVLPSGQIREKLCETRLRFKRLSRPEIEAYIASREWQGKAGGYAVQGRAAAFVTEIVGSYPNVVGLPLYDVATMLAGEGYPLLEGWVG
jgi:septum formation protein